jgi:hypothetical protein
MAIRLIIVFHYESDTFSGLLGVGMDGVRGRPATQFRTAHTHPNHRVGAVSGLDAALKTESFDDLSRAQWF